MNKDIKYIDAEQYQGGSSNQPVSYEMIILEHLRKIASLMSSELRGGYWQNKLVTSKEKGTYTEKVYVPDSREPLTNSIDFFYYLLLMF